MNRPENDANKVPHNPGDGMSRLVVLVDDTFPKLSLWIEDQLEELEYRWKHFSTPRSLRARRRFRR